MSRLSSYLALYTIRFTISLTRAKDLLHARFLDTSHTHEWIYAAMRISVSQLKTRQKTKSGSRICECLCVRHVALLRVCERTDDLLDLACERPVDTGLVSVDNNVVRLSVTDTCLRAVETD